jgi:hypothetical protein
LSEHKDFVRRPDVENDEAAIDFSEPHEIGEHCAGQRVIRCGGREDSIRSVIGCRGRLQVGLFGILVL